MFLPGASTFVRRRRREGVVLFSFLPGDQQVWPPMADLEATGQRKKCWFREETSPQRVLPVQLCVGGAVMQRCSDAVQPCNSLATSSKVRLKCTRAAQFDEAGLG
jgi:hypothetical protein